MKRYFAYVFLLSSMLALSAHAEVGGGDVVFKSPKGDVKFSHEDHVVDAELNCQSCHVKYFLNSKLSKKKSCRKDMVKKQSCGACHDGKRQRWILTAAQIATENK